MRYAERIADEAAHHYAELRERRVSRLPAILMALVFHHTLCRAVLYDDHFEDVIAQLLTSVTEEQERA